MGKKQHLSKTNWGSGDTPCAPFCDRTQESSLTSSTMRFASMSSVCSETPCPIQPLRELLHRRFQKALLYPQRALGDVHVHTRSIYPQHSGRNRLTSSRNVAGRDRRYTLCTFSSPSACLLFMPCLLLQASPLSLKTRELGRHLLHGTLSQAHMGIRILPAAWFEPALAKTAFDRLEGRLIMALSATSAAR